MYTLYRSEMATRWMKFTRSDPRRLPHRLLICDVEASVLRQLSDYLEAMPQTKRIRELGFQLVQLSDETGALQRVPAHDLAAMAVSCSGSARTLLLGGPSCSPMSIALSRSWFPMYRHVMFSCEPWSENFKRRYRRWDAGEFAKRGQRWERVDPTDDPRPSTSLDIGIRISPADMGLTDKAHITDILAKVTGDRTWIRCLARVLLAETSAASRHTLTLHLQRDTPMRGDGDRKRFRDANRRCTDTLNDIIAALVESRREIRPKGYRHLLHRRYSAPADQSG